MLQNFFTFFQTYRGGIFFFLFCLGFLAFLVQWFAWIFGWGRFGNSATWTGGGTGSGTGSGSARTNIRYLFSGAFVKIVNDFRHLLALIIVLIFAVALLYSLWKAASIGGSGENSTINNMKEALQAVVATLGGLVGSIIGYYFGESSSVKPPETKILTPPPDNAPIKGVNLPAQAGTTGTVEPE
jgi:hypothetical protein